MRVEFNVLTVDSFLCGLLIASGEDENGQFNMLSLGFLFFSIDFLHYNK